MAKRKRLGPALTDTPPAAGTSAAPTAARPPAPPIADMAGASSAMAALTEMSDALQDARRSGRMVILADLEAIDTGYLVRDRAQMSTEELDALRSSIIDRGQQVPIEVVDLGDGRYGLISGWRRLTVLKELRALYPEQDSFGQVQCLIRTPKAASDAYIAMVEENEIRESLSFYERARIAALATSNGVFEDQRAALRGLFGSVSRAKRSKIKSFMVIYEQLDRFLAFPAQIPEHLGLALSARLEREPGFSGRIASALNRPRPQTAASEREILDLLMAPAKPAPKPAPEPQDAGPVTVKNGREYVTLRGPAVTPHMQDALGLWLEQWLRENP